MRKFYVFIFSLLILGMVTLPADAQRRGAQTNHFASWVSVTGGNTTTTVSLPTSVSSRDIIIHNGSAIDVCVNLKDSDFATDFDTGMCYSASTPNTTFQLNGTATISLQDYITNQVSFRSAGADASPVSVIVTY